VRIAWRLLVVVAAAALGMGCLCADGRTAGGSGDDPTDGGTTSDGGGGGGGGEFSCSTACNSPPAATCAETPQADGTTLCQATTYDPAGGCESGACTYAAVPAACPYGCDADGSACLGAADYCAGVPCGTVHDCTGGCDHGTGCCSPTSYERTSGFTANGGTVCCDGTDVAVAVIDCGDGADHWASPSGTSCGVAYEGSDNYGGPCVTVMCAGQDCW
jgi:hypothetical protein